MTPQSDSDPVAAEAAPVSSITASSQGPGELVRQGRERASLSVEELAQQTKLARFTIEALERDDFSVLNEAVYIRGYYRKVAKALALPETELLAAYTAMVTPKAPPAPTKLLLGSGDNGAPRTRKRGGWGLVLSILAILVLLYFAVHLLNRQAPSGGKTGAPRVSAAGGNSNTRSLASTNTGAAPAALASAPVGQSAVGAAPGIPAPVASTPSTPAAAPPTGAAAASPADPDAKTLELEFSASSWVHIEDASGKLLLSGVIQAGAHQTVSGRPPMAVFLGNAHGVAVSEQGRPIDIAPYIKDNATARFSVP